MFALSAAKMMPAQMKTSAAERVGSTGRVVGIDLAEEMIRILQDHIEQAALPNVEVRITDAEKLDFPDTTFDAVLCGYAIFFFPNVLQALVEFRRVLKPGGLLAVSTQGTADERWRWWGELLRFTFCISIEQNLNLSNSGALPPRLTASDQGWFRFKTKFVCDPGRPGPLTGGAPACAEGHFGGAAQFPGGLSISDEVPKWANKAPALSHGG